MDPQCPECASPAEIIMQDEENVVADSETGDKNICTERSERFSLLSVLSLSDESSEEHISTGSSDTEPPMMIKVTVTPKRNTQVEETENQSDSPEPLDNPEYLEEPNEYKRQEEDSQDATPPNDSDFFGIEIPSLNLQLDGIETSSDSSERAYCLEMALPAFSHLRNSPEYRSESVRSRTLSMSNTSSEDFDLLSMLGQGNFGKVFLSDHKPTNSKFAVKAIPRRKYDQHAAQRIQTEKDIMQLVTDKKAPFLVGLDASFVTNYNECLVMEYAPGGDLRSLMDKYDLPLECTR
ncbi:serine/threonine-protein kinase N1-like [Xenopus tropicalis]|uniref:non-specific serine/threonine protein kinase n=1 Tax=Xenopus tropicalis TaxID=8364 RepID=A0A8J1INS0_XENTR|nr:serine/threonine-protein kinase N1-like [Xenopus tropicalis]